MHSPIVVSVHFITEVAVLQKKFDTFKLVEYQFKQADGKVLTVDVYAESNEYPQIVDLGVIDVTTYQEATE